MGEVGWEIIFNFHFFKIFVNYVSALLIVFLLLDYNGRSKAAVNKTASGLTNISGYQYLKDLHYRLNPFIHDNKKPHQIEKDISELRSSIQTLCFSAILKYILKMFSQHL